MHKIRRIGVESTIQTLRDWTKQHEKPTLRSTVKERNPFKTMIACLISLRTQDSNTKKASENLFRVADTPKGISELPLEEIEKRIYSCGYYRMKAKTIKHVAGVILKKYGGKVPSSTDELLSIKGIGRKTATITRVFGFRKADCIPVDVHVHVIANRFGWVKSKSPEDTEIQLMKIIPKEYWFEINTLLVLFGQKICQTNSPLCSECPLKKNCLRINVERSR